MVLEQIFPTLTTMSKQPYRHPQIRVQWERWQDALVDKLVIVYIRSREKGSVTKCWIPMKSQASWTDGRKPGSLLCDRIHSTFDDNAVHRSEAPEVHDGICSTLDGKCSTPMRLLMYMMAYAAQPAHLLANTVHQVRFLIYMMGYAVHLMANAVHPREAPEVHHDLCSTLDG